jgi:hypothetical protein
MRTPWIIGTVLSAGIALDLLSIIGWSAPVWGTFITVSLLVIITVLSLRDIRFGVASILLELLWGSHGYLLRIPAGGLNLSLRMGIFFVVVAATVWHLRRHESRVAVWSAFRGHPVRWPALAFFATLALGLILGLARHPFDRVFFDANAWAFLLLLPSFLLAWRVKEFDTPWDGSGERVPLRGAYSEEAGMVPARSGRATERSERAPPRWGGASVPTEWHRDLSCRPMAIVLLTGALYLILRTYLLLFVFSHDLGGFWLAAYQWVRDTSLGEVTIFPGAFPRVFLPSMVLLFPALLLALHALRSLRGAPTLQSERRGNLDRHAWITISYLVFGGSIAVLLISLSRSYWLAGVVLLAVGVGTIATRAWRPRNYSLIRTNRRIVRVWCTAISSAAVAIILAVVVVTLPYPKPLTTAGVGETLLARLSSDAAVSNRWQQLEPLRDAIGQHPILGSGFGAAVTYETRDPRTLAAYPDGKYTTTAFEWGYLDDLLERGLLGLLAELWFLGSLIWFALRQQFSPPLVDGEREEVSLRTHEQTAFSLGLLAIAIVHATSPYLNHPLGIGLLLWLFAMKTPRPHEGERGA